MYCTVVEKQKLGFKGELKNYLPSLDKWSSRAHYSNLPEYIEGLGN